MELKSPTRKGYKCPAHHCPLPICKDSSAICCNEYDWPLFTGQFNGSSVIIDDPNEMITLSKKGCFGKGSLSRGCPRSGKRKILLNVISESQWKRRKLWSEALTAIVKNKNINIDSSNHSEDSSKEDNSTKFSEGKSVGVSMNVETVKGNTASNEKNKLDDAGKSDEEKVDTEQKIDEGKIDNEKKIDEEKVDNDTKEINSSEDVINNLNIECENKSQVKGLNQNKQVLGPNEVLVIADLENNVEDPFAVLNPHIEKENVKTVIEVLYLSLEEAFFLSYALNCLQVVDLTSKFLSIREMWMLFQQSQTDFIEKYVAYHYFRSKGWVVKSGIKFGGDFLLYKMSPQYFHASYIVLIQLLNPDGCKTEKTDSLTWEKAVGINRMAESASKEILVCQIKKPDVPKEKLSDPDILKEYRVSEILLRRWQWQKVENNSKLSNS